VVVFFPDEEDAIFSLRDALWGEHKLGVLLPKTGENPLTIMEAFKYGEYPSCLPRRTLFVV
jgi:hypothetical protein